MKMLYLNKMLLTFSALSLICLNPACSTDSPTFADGKKMYLDGQYAKAAQTLRSYLVAHPDNFRAHYLLACSYVGLGQKDAAIEHYQLAIQIAIQIAPKSAVAVNSRAELTKLSSGTSQTSSATDRLTLEHKGQLQVEYDAKIREVQSDAERKIAKLNQQNHYEINNLGVPVQKNGHVYWAPDPAPVNAAYQAKIDAVNKEADKKIADLNAECTRRTAELGASRNSPASTNLHIQNFDK